MGYLRLQAENTITKPNRNIVVTDPSYLFQNPVMLDLINLKNGTYLYEIKGIDGTTFFYCINKTSNYEICTEDLRPIVNFKKSLVVQSDRVIYYGSKREEIMAKLIKKNSFVANKWSVEYFNKATNNTEILDLNIESTYSSGGVFDGKEKEGAPMIARFLIQPKKKLLEIPNYTIEIAAGVDNLFMIILAIFMQVDRAEEEERRRRRNAQRNRH